MSRRAVPDPDRRADVPLDEPDDSDHRRDCIADLADAWGIEIPDPLDELHREPDDDQVWGRA